jgi:hypothetical protein
VTSGEKISIRPYQPSQAAEWKAFLARSNNGVLFHDLDFLAYHPPERFQVHNLMFYESDRLIALLPASVEVEADGRRFLKSPYGASVGGPVLPPRLSVEAALDLVACLKNFAAVQGLQGIEMRIGPDVYLQEPNDLLSFSLMVSGFQLTHRGLSFVIPIGSAGPNPAAELLSSRDQRNLRADLKKGLYPREVGSDRVGDFHRILVENSNRRKARPTHDRDELDRIFRLVPGCVRVFLCAYGQTEIAGELVFILNNRAAYSMYLCQSDLHRKLRAPAILVTHVMQCLAKEGVQYLDVGPSASDQHLNSGVAGFKERLGAQGFCRDTWRWECPAVSVSP